MPSKQDTPTSSVAAQPYLAMPLSHDAFNKLPVSQAPANWLWVISLWTYCIFLAHVKVRLFECRHRMIQHDQQEKRIGRFISAGFGYPKRVELECPIRRPANPPTRSVRCGELEALFGMPSMASGLDVKELLREARRSVAPSEVKPTAL